MTELDVWWPASVPSDQDGTRRARDELLANGLLAPPGAVGVRTVIERSWRRCVGDAVPVALGELPYRDAADLQPRLQEAAAPVLDRLADHLGDVRVAIVLSDESGRIIMRRATESRTRSALDNAHAAEGFDFSEAAIGTNGLGTVVAERRPTLVHGTEHYNDALGSLTCAGTPIFEPFTRRMLGTVSLTCVAAEATPLMCTMATDVGRQIEGNLTAMLGARERVLIRSYLLANRAERDPVIVVNERSAFANTAGLTHLTADSHALLWVHLRESGLRAGSHHTRVPLPGGWHDAVVEPVEDGAQAYCVRLVDRQAPPRRSGAAPARPARQLHALPDVDEQLRTAVRLGECLALDGGPGTGKLHVATAVLAERSAAPPFVVDLATGPAAVAALADAPPDRPVVLRHLENLAAGDGNRVRALAAAITTPLVITVDLDAAAEHVHAVVGRLATTVRLPPLRERHEQIPQLVAAVLAELPAPLRRTTFATDALQLLMGWSWPGNVAELRRTVEQLARRRPGRPIGVADLPGRLAQNRRALTMMESAERDAILAALRRCNGNRAQAARALGIGRTTLYRKLQEHHIGL